MIFEKNWRKPRKKITLVILIMLTRIVNSQSSQNTVHAGLQDPHLSSCWLSVSVLTWVTVSIGGWNIAYIYPAKLLAHLRGEGGLRKTSYLDWTRRPQVGGGLRKTSSLLQFRMSSISNENHIKFIIRSYSIAL